MTTRPSSAGPPPSPARLSRRRRGPHLPPPGPGVHALEDVGLPGTLLVVPPAVAPETPLLVFLHGAGGSGPRSLPVVADQAAARGALVLLPSSADRTWDLLLGGLGRDAAALGVALDHVQQRYAVGPLALAGFSDGASYALSLGLAHGDVVGTVLAFAPGFAAPPEQVGRPRVWLAHGTRDAVLPVERCGRRVAATLDRAGYEVHYEEFDGGHVVLPAHVEQALAWWLDDRPDAPGRHAATTSAP